MTRWLLVLPLLALLDSRSAAAEPESGLERISLTQAVQRAWQQSPAALLAQQDVELSAAQVAKVRAQALPTLVAGGTYTRIDDDRRIGDQVFVPANQLGANLTLSAPLVAPQRWAAWALASDDQRTAKLDALELRRQVALRVAHAYLAVLSAQRVVEVSVRAVDIAQAHYAHARKRLGGGVGSQLDEVRAEQLWREEAGRLLRARAELLRSQGSLGALLGENRPMDAADPPELPAVASDSSETTLAELHGQLQALRADVVAQSARLRAAERAVNLRFVDYLPTLSGTFMPMYQDPASLVQPPLAWQAQLQLTIPIFDGGLRYGELRDRRARRAVAQLHLQDLVQQGRVELQVGLGVLGHSQRALSEARSAQALARRAVDIAALSYRMGAATNLELLDAQRRAHDAETAAVLAEDEVRRVQVDLLAATGRFP
jgi:outer membrane protein TolC